MTCSVTFHDLPWPSAAGTHPAQGVLLRAGPGTGKTVSLSQLTRLMAIKLLRQANEPPAAPPPSASAAQPSDPIRSDPIGLVPLLLNVQRLAAYMKRSTSAHTADLLAE